MAGLAEAVGAATGAPWWSLSDGDALRMLTQMEVLRRQFEAARLSLVADVDSRGAAVSAGAKSTRAWLVAKTGVSSFDARRSVKLAGDLAAQAPAARAALVAGVLSLDHTRVVAATITTLHSTLQQRGMSCGPQVLDSAEATMLDLARSLDPGQLATAGAVLIETIAPSPDPDGDALSDEVRRVMSISRFSDGGGSFRGELDREGLALLEAALSPLSAPLPATAEGRDRRSPERRRGDALVDLARRAVAAGDLPAEGGLDTTVVVSTSLERLRGEVVEAEPTLDTGIELPAGVGAPPRLRRHGPRRGARHHVAAPGHRSGVAAGPGRDSSRSDPAGQALRLPRLPSRRSLVSRTSRRALGKRWTDRAGQSVLALPAPSPADPPLRVGSRNQPRRSPRVRRARVGYP